MSQFLGHSFWIKLKIKTSLVITEYRHTKLDHFKAIVIWNHPTKFTFEHAYLRIYLPCNYSNDFRHNCHIWVFRTPEQFSSDRKYFLSNLINSIIESKLLILGLLDSGTILTSQTLVTVIWRIIWPCVPRSSQTHKSWSYSSMLAELRNLDIVTTSWSVPEQGNTILDTYSRKIFIEWARLLSTFLL